MAADDLRAALEERLASGDNGAGFILDGFPRNIAQAEALDTLRRITADWPEADQRLAGFEPLQVDDDLSPGQVKA